MRPARVEVPVVLEGARDEDVSGRARLRERPAGVEEGRCRPLVDAEREVPLHRHSRRARDVGVEPPARQRAGVGQAQEHVLPGRPAEIPEQERDRHADQGQAGEPALGRGIRCGDQTPREQNCRRRHQVDEEPIVHPRNRSGRQKGGHEKGQQHDVRAAPMPEGHGGAQREPEEHRGPEPLVQQGDGPDRAVSDRGALAREEPEREQASLAHPFERREGVAGLEHAHPHQGHQQQAERRDRDPA